MTDNDEIHRTRKKYNTLILFSAAVWLLILILYVYKIFDKILFRNCSVAIILLITALISTEIMEIFKKSKISTG